MLEIVNNFQVKCLLTGTHRATLLQKVLSCAIAYSSPCFVGESSDSGAFYNTTVLDNASKIISKVNERIFIDIEQALLDTNRIWEGRYQMVNSPLQSKELISFFNEIEKADPSVSANFDYWVAEFVKAVKAELGRLNGVA